MASIRQHSTSGIYLASFRFGGRQFTKSLKTKSRRSANAHRARIEETIRLLMSGRIQIPPGVDPGTFILSDGMVKEKQVLPKCSVGRRCCDDAKRHGLYSNRHRRKFHGKQTGSVSRHRFVSYCFGACVGRGCEVSASLTGLVG